MAPPAPFGVSWFDRSGAAKPVPASIGVKPNPWIYAGGEKQPDESSFFEVPLRPRSRAELPPIGADLGNQGSAARAQTTLRASPRPGTRDGAGMARTAPEPFNDALPQDNKVSSWLQELRQENIWASTSTLNTSSSRAAAFAVLPSWQWIPAGTDFLNTAMPVVPPSLIVRPMSSGKPNTPAWRSRRERSPKSRVRGESPRSRSKKATSQEVVRSFLRKQGAGGKELKEDDSQSSFGGRPASGKPEPAAEGVANAPKSCFKKDRQRNSILHVGGHHSVLVSSHERESHASAHARESTCRRSKFCGDGKHQDSADALSRHSSSDAPADLLVTEEIAPVPTIRRRSWLTTSEDVPNSQEPEPGSRAASKSILHCSLGEQVWKAAEKRYTVRSKFHFKQEKPEKPKLSERMKRIEIRRTDRMKQIRSERHHELKVRQFNQMPEDEREALTQAFAAFDEDKSGYLENNEVLACMHEFGLAGHTSEEKRAILDICTEATNAGNPLTPKSDSSEDSERKVAIDIYDLALTVVPEVRQKLVELRGDDLLKQFFKYDLDGSGKLSKQESLELARDMGLDPRMMTEGMGDEDEIDFELFQDLIAKGREQLARVVRDKERACQRRMGLPESAFQDFREDLISLHDIFARYDKDESGTLSKVEMNFMLKEFGLQPTTAQEKEAIDAILRYNDMEMLGEVNFIEFLDVVRQIRTIQLEKRREQQQERFAKYDKDKSGFLSHSEISMLLADLGFVPSTRKEQDELAYLISSVDADGSGCIDFPEFQNLCQRIDEKLKSFRYEEEVEFAMRLGFTEKQMRDLRWVFDSLDIDGSNKLDAAEVRNGLVMMRKHVSTESFETSFRALDKDGSGELDFTEFLSFMRMMRDGEGISSEETQKLAVKARNLDTRILRRVLEYFRLARRYINSLNHDDLVNLFCEYFKVGPHTNLHEVLDVRTVGELYEAARVRDARMQALEN
mmetsp:Transcript_100007/g.173527  ORF Transcript_100007/g.173527 Transcript_100007/m.173527 type:complete len:963 (-) Transcript_100007:11-2899(-)